MESSSTREGNRFRALPSTTSATGQTTPFYAPSGGVWFQDSDASGQFHLTSLPRGPVKLMVYRKQEGAYRQIEGIRYVDVSSGQALVHIEMPDENDRLRGIE